MKKLILLCMFLVLNMIWPTLTHAVSGKEFVSTYYTSLGGAEAHDILVYDGSWQVMAGSTYACDPTYCQGGFVARIGPKGQFYGISAFGANSETLYDKLYLSRVAQDQQGSLYAVGAQGFWYHGSWDLFITRTNTGGSPTWQKKLDHNTADSQYPYDIVCNSDGTVGVLAQVTTTYGEAPCGSLSRAIYYYRFNALDGSVVSEKVVGYEGNAMFVSDGFIVVDADNETWIDSKRYFFLVLKKYDRDANLEWIQCYPSYRETPGGAVHYIELGGELVLGEFDQGYVVAASFVNGLDYPGLLFQIDLEGKLNWMKITDINASTDKQTYPKGILVFSDGGCLLSTQNGYTDVGNVLTRFDQDGDMQWSMALASPNSLTVLGKHLDYGFIGYGHPTTSIVGQMMVGWFPDPIPAGDSCVDAGLTFSTHNPTITDVIASENTSGSRGGCTFAKAVLEDVNWFLPEVSMSGDKYCGPPQYTITPVINTILLY